LEREYRKFTEDNIVDRRCAAFPTFGDSTRCAIIPKGKHFTAFRVISSAADFGSRINSLSSRLLRAARRVHIRLHESASLQLGTRLRLPSGISPSFPFTGSNQVLMQFATVKSIPRFLRPFPLAQLQPSKGIKVYTINAEK
jgi:hypothetical protein